MAIDRIGADFAVGLDDSGCKTSRRQATDFSANTPLANSFARHESSAALILELARRLADYVRFYGGEEGDIQALKAVVATLPADSPEAAAISEVIEAEGSGRLSAEDEPVGAIITQHLFVFTLKTAANSIYELPPLPVFDSVEILAVRPVLRINGQESVLEASIVATDLLEVGDEIALRQRLAEKVAFSVWTIGDLRYVSGEWGS